MFGLFTKKSNSNANSAAVSVRMESDTEKSGYASDLSEGFGILKMESGISVANSDFLIEKKTSIASYSEYSDGSLNDTRSWGNGQRWSWWQASNADKKAMGVDQPKKQHPGYYHAGKKSKLSPSDEENEGAEFCIERKTSCVSDVEEFIQHDLTLESIRMRAMEAEMQAQEVRDNSQKCERRIRKHGWGYLDSVTEGEYDN